MYFHFLFFIFVHFNVRQIAQLLWTRRQHAVSALKQRAKFPPRSFLLGARPARPGSFSFPPFPVAVPSIRPLPEPERTTQSIGRQEGRNSYYSGCGLSARARTRTVYVLSPGRFPVAWERGQSGQSGRSRSRRDTDDINSGGRRPVDRMRLDNASWRERSDGQANRRTGIIIPGRLIAVLRIRYSLAPSLLSYARTKRTA